MKTHKDLTVWREAMKLGKEVYQLTSDFPKDKYRSTYLKALEKPSEI